MFWNDWYAGWGWFLWAAVFFYFFAILGSWSYTYGTRRRHDLGMYQPKSALDLLDERYARGEIKRDEYLTVKADLQSKSLQKVA